MKFGNVCIVCVRIYALHDNMHIYIYIVLIGSRDDCPYFKGWIKTLHRKKKIKCP